MRLGLEPISGLERRRFCPCAGAAQRDDASCCLWCLYAPSRILSASSPRPHALRTLAASSLRTFSATSVHCTASPPPLFAPPLHLSALCRRSLHPRTGDLCPLQVTFGGGGRAHGPTTASWLHRPSLNPSSDPGAHLSANLNPYPDIDTDPYPSPGPDPDFRPRQSNPSPNPDLPPHPVALARALTITPPKPGLVVPNPAPVLADPIVTLTPGLAH